MTGDAAYSSSNENFPYNLQNESWLSSAVSDVYSAVAANPVESAVVAAVAVGGAVAWAASRGKIPISFARNANLEDYRQSVHLLDWPKELRGVTSIPKNKMVDLKDGAKALVDKDGYLTTYAPDRSTLFMMNRDGSRVGHVYGDKSLLKSSYEISGLEGEQLAARTRLARTADEAEMSYFSYTRDLREREGYRFISPNRKFGWSANEGTPIRDTVTKAFDTVENDLLGRATRLLKEAGMMQ